MTPSHKKNQSRKGAILPITLVAVTVGGLILGSLMEYSSKNRMLVEKEIGHVKAAEALKLAQTIYNATLSNKSGTMSDSQINQLQRRIGGKNSSTPTIFGYTSAGSPSQIPGFKQFTIDWLPPTVNTTSNVMETSTTLGFRYFPGISRSKVLSVHTDPYPDPTDPKGGVPALRDNSKAVLSSESVTQIVPVFNMLAFYDKDWEVAAHRESAQLIGRIHTNAAAYLDCRESGPDRVRFHGPRDFPLISAAKSVYRRGRNGATSYYRYGTPANQGLDFYVYTPGVVNALVSPTTFNYTNNDAGMLIKRDMTPDYTNSETNGNGPSADANPAEWIRRRFLGDGADFGYRFTGTSVQSPPNPSFQYTSTTGTNYDIVDFGVAALQPPVAINPYQYVEDTQFFDTPDTVDYPQPQSSNYQEDAAQDNSLSSLALNSIAPLVIRDGVAYYRTTPGGTLRPVMDLLVGNKETLYPDATHPEAKYYGDLRWYGWFGMNSGVTAPTPDNPARWHFPIQSVTFNATQDANNAGDVGTTPAAGTALFSGGTAVPFTFRNATVLDPTKDGVKDQAGVSFPPPWIERDEEVAYNVVATSPFKAYPDFTNATGDALTGAGTGMWNVAYPIIQNGKVERFDPVRVAYNVVKEAVRDRYNSTHRYTSRHNGQKMLNRGFGSVVPADGMAPNVWGDGQMPNAAGVDYSGDGVVDYSAFWNDNGAIGHTSQSTKFLFLRIQVSEVNGGPNLSLSNIRWMQGSNATPPSAVGNTNAMTVPVSLPEVPTSYTLTASASSNSGSSYFAFNNVSTDAWTVAAPPTTTPSDPTDDPWIQVKLGDLAGNNGRMAPDVLILQAFGTADAPKNFSVQASDSSAGPWVTLGSFQNVTWTANDQTQLFALPRKYRYQRDSSVAETSVLKGELHLTVPDTDPPVEIFPIRHKSLLKLSDTPNPMTNWYIYKSTLPFSDRTLAMPADRQSLDGWNYNNTSPDFQESDRIKNFGFSGAKKSPLAPNVYNNGSAYNHNFQNWYTLLNNAPEMLARQATGATGITFETDFRYYAGDFGGHYGIDNLCMIDDQEKKITVFTQIDLSEFTKECLTFNGLSANTAWGFNFDSNTNVGALTQDKLQNIVYVVNTSMGSNFFGQRVHCGAVRLKRGATLTHRLSIATPNALHILGDFNCPGYLHHGKVTSAKKSVSYTVPMAKEFIAGPALKPQPVALYADSLHVYENSWIPFNRDDSSPDNDDLRDDNYGSLQDSTTYSTENILFDQKLWWEDDGMRRDGDRSSVSTFGAQLYLNYHETILNHDNNDMYLKNSAWDRGPNSNQIWKHIPQGINAALLYGNVPSVGPSYFLQADVNAIPVARPSAGIDLLDWYMNWIPRNRWQEISRDQLRDDAGSTLTRSGGFNPFSVNPAAVNAALTLDNYYDTKFPTTNFGGPTAATAQFENCKLKFNGGGYLYDLRPHTNQTENLPSGENSGLQDLGRNVRGGFACLFESRQATHGWNEAVMGVETPQTFYSYDTSFDTATNIPPGTPMVTIVPSVNMTLQGAKWEY